MHELGFDGYAIDYVSCPEGLKWFLTTNMNLHRIVSCCFAPLQFVTTKCVNICLGVPLDHPWFLKF